MGSLRTSLRLSARTSLLRQSPFSRPSALIQRSYATGAPGRRAADERKATEEVEMTPEDFNEFNDPGMNGGYPDPSLTSALPLKRSLRDPYGDWWDSIERRNYGEPVHEDNDILGVFSTEEYRHFTPARGVVLISIFIATVVGLSWAVGRVYPDMPAVHRTFEDGLEAELGGPKAVRARKEHDEETSI